MRVYHDFFLYPDSDQRFLMRIQIRIRIRPNDTDPDPKHWPWRLISVLQSVFILALYIPNKESLQGLGKFLIMIMEDGEVFTLMEEIEKGLTS